VSTIQFDGNSTYLPHRAHEVSSVPHPVAVCVPFAGVSWEGRQKFGYMCGAMLRDVSPPSHTHTVPLSTGYTIPIGESAPWFKARPGDCTNGFGSARNALRSPCKTSAPPDRFINSSVSDVNEYAHS